MMDEIFNNEIAKQFTSAILDKYLSPIISKTTDKFKTLYNEAKINLEIPFQDYLTNSYEKYSKIKTIIYGIEPKRLYDFFEIPFLKECLSYSILLAKVYLIDLHWLSFLLK